MSSWWEAGQLISTIYCSKSSTHRSHLRRTMHVLTNFRIIKKSSHKNKGTVASMISDLMLVLQFFITAFLTAV